MGFATDKQIRKNSESAYFENNHGSKKWQAQIIIILRFINCLTFLSCAKEKERGCEMSPPGLWSATRGESAPVLHLL